MGAVRESLVRLSAATAAARAAGWARRWHTRLLLAAAALAWVSAVLLPLPGLAALRGRWGATLVAAAALVLAGLALRLVARPWLRTPPSRLAARLDDERGWKDTASTALEVERQAAASPVGGWLVARALVLVAGVAPPVPPAAQRGRPWLRIALVALFLAALLLPGVDGSLGLRGAGRREEPRHASVDDWLREHARLRLDRVPEQERCSLRVAMSFQTDAPLPADYAADVTLLWDGVARGVLGPVEARAGETARLGLVWDLGATPLLEGHRALGEHEVSVRLVPTRGPYTVALVCDPVTLEVCDGGGGGGGTSPPQPPRPEPPPPTPQPTPAPEGPQDPPPKPPPSGREEAVKPLVNEGETVKKDAAVVEVKDPDAGTKPPPAVPLAEALRDFEKVVERAVGSERIPPADRDYLRRYFRELQRLAAPPPPGANR